ncbi:tumor necrosis factor ligand superfamily member 14-like [Colossoma macropomum]|uniref:tumor necrosis factor ligand superfamily member 14-like n=1 Tax=Colossoma macropomum TaxID=42526 RepID=UPI00186518B0|nr:tumor necrosis factor ligand superfamily member 14-like [Colossoma macropomum]
MASKGAEYPSVFVVDSRAGIPPLPPKPGHRQAQRRRSRVTQTMLYLLVSMALFGIVVEACLIYHLYKTKQSSEPLNKDKDTPQTDARKGEHVMEHPTVPPKRTKPPLFKKPLKPLAHLSAGGERPGADGVMPWNDKVDLDLHELEYKENKLVVEKEGYYYIYSKLCFDADEASFHHLVVRTTSRFTGPYIELLRNRYYGDHSKPPKKEGSMKNSYVGGVFHLYKGDAVFVVVKSGTVRLQNAADNYFGMFMV